MSSENLSEERLRSIDLTEAREFAVDIAQHAGELLRARFASGEFTMRLKGVVDLVTQADEEVDAFLRAEIAKKYPTGQLLTEETAPKEYSHLKSAESLWVIDPLDGTTNFSRGSPHFSVSIALVEKGITQMAVVHVPMTGDMYSAQANKEFAFLNGNPIHVSETSDVKQSIFAFDWPYDFVKRAEIVQLLGIFNSKVRALKCMGSAVADLASLARGQIDVYMHAGLKPWDVAASSLLIQKAGGTITTKDGCEWDVFQPDILATNGFLHATILEIARKNS